MGIYRRHNEEKRPRELNTHITDEAERENGSIESTAGPNKE